MDFAVIGGDMRQAKLAEMLAADGHTVISYGLGEAAAGVKAAERLEAAVDATYIVLPLPAAEGGALNAPMCKEKIEIKRLFSLIKPGKTVFLGKADDELRGMAKDAGIRTCDYFAREELVVKNAAATAEGALQIIMEELPVTLQGARCLVMGFGRIGKLLSRKLYCLGAEVAVSARKFSDFAWIEANGYKWTSYEKINDQLGKFDVVINTIPARVLGKDRIDLLKSECFCLDLASKPGGLDFKAAAEAGIKAIWALSLPGRVAPVTSGMIIRDTIYNIISELEGGH